MRAANIGQSTWAQIPEQEQELLLYQLNQKRIEMEQNDPENIINISILGGYGCACPDPPPASAFPSPACLPSWPILPP